MVNLRYPPFFKAGECTLFYRNTISKWIIAYQITSINNDGKVRISRWEDCSEKIWGCPFFRQPGWTSPWVVRDSVVRFHGKAIQTPNKNWVTSNFPLFVYCICSFEGLILKRFPVIFLKGLFYLCVFNVPSKSAGEMPFPYGSLTITQQKWTNLLFTLAIPSTLKNEARLIYSLAMPWPRHTPSGTFQAKAIGVEGERKQRDASLRGVSTWKLLQVKGSQ